MALVLTFLGVSVAIFVLLWAGSLLIQPYLYSEAADRLPLRAAVGGLALGCFLTAWTFVNTRADSPDKFGTFFEFNPTASREVTEFDAVRRLNRKGPDGQWAEETVTFKRVPGREVGFGEGGDPAHRYTPNTSGFMTVAVLLPEPGGGTKTRFDAALDPKGQSYLAGSEKVFQEKGGRRYVEVDAPALVYAPSRWAALGALALNLAHFGLWFLVLWPVMRYEPGPALGGAVVFGLVTMLAVMPLLFNSNRPPAAGVVAR